MTWPTSQQTIVPVNYTIRIQDDPSHTGIAHERNILASIGNTGKDAVQDKVNTQLAQLEDHLVTRYAHQGHHTEPEIRAQFQRATQHFTDARVRLFLPILVERIVEEELTHLGDKAAADHHD
jgi:K+ transporter